MCQLRGFSFKLNLSSPTCERSSGIGRRECRTIPVHNRRMMKDEAASFLPLFEPRTSRALDSSATANLLKRSRGTRALPIPIRIPLYPMTRKDPSIVARIHPVTSVTASSIRTKCCFRYDDDSRFFMPTRPTLLSFLSLRRRLDYPDRG